MIIKDIYYLDMDVCNALAILLDNSFIRYGGTMYRQIVGIPMGTDGEPLVADSLLLHA